MPNDINITIIWIADGREVLRRITTRDAGDYYFPHPTKKFELDGVWYQAVRYERDEEARTVTGYFEPSK
ncbi:MAG: hypothetical protein JST51_01430 [Armatimonadetes bacterium]|nr:hypothetical protein [Armatimonadota bacterium]